MFLEEEFAGKILDFFRDEGFMKWSEEKLRGLMVDGSDFRCCDEIVRLNDVKR